MKQCSILILSFALVIFLEGSARSSEPIKITEIRDANLFQTEDGRLISLSNVESFSIFDSDSLKKQFAEEVVSYGQQWLVNDTLHLEYQYRADSVQFVHLFEKIGRTRRSINQLYLKKGFGYFVENPHSQYSDYYRVAAKEAKKDGLGVHGFLPRLPFVSNAAWLSVGLGAGVTFKEYTLTKSVKSAFGGEISGYYRKNWVVFGTGFSVICNEHDYALKTLHCTIGKSFYKRYEDIVLSAGISLNEYERTFEGFYIDDEYHMDSGVIKSKKYWGVHFEINSVAHFSHVLGLGLKLSADWNSEISYVVLSVCPGLGSWDF